MHCVISADRAINADTLMSLSNASRLEAIQTFDHLSRRLPQSALSLSSSKQAERHVHSSQNRRAKHSASAKDTRHPRSNSTLSLIPAASSDQPRPRHSRKRASSKSSTTLSKAPHSTPNKHRSTGLQKPASNNKNNNPRAAPPAPRDSSRTSPRSERRHASMSSRSDSTKLGEVPERKWRTTAGPRNDSSNSSNSLRVAYPLYSYPAPQKQRSRFMRFFGK
jgi:hypothetical protein